MRRFLQFVGTILYFGLWPAFWIYYRLGHDRTRVVLWRDGKVLAVKQWISAGKWSLPGGGIHKGETPAVAASRELREETGLRFESRQLRPVGKGMFRQHGLSYEYHVFVAKAGPERARIQWIELSELKWLRPEELNNNNALPDTLHALRIAK